MSVIMASLAALLSAAMAAVAKLKADEPFTVQLRAWLTEMQELAEGDKPRTPPKVEHPERLSEELRRLRTAAREAAVAYRKELQAASRRADKERKAKHKAEYDAGRDWVRERATRIEKEMSPFAKSYFEAGSPDLAAMIDGRCAHEHVHPNARHQEFEFMWGWAGGAVEVSVARESQPDAFAGSEACDDLGLPRDWESHEHARPGSMLTDALIPLWRASDHYHDWRHAAHRSL